MTRQGNFLFITMAVGLLALGACKKEAGSGGTSAITGSVSGREYYATNGDLSEAEVTEITVPDGADIEDGEYFLLNTPVGGSLYYVWFKWNNGVAPDPGLLGRTGIQVDFDFTETNVEVAANIVAAITAEASADFTVSLNNDIVTVTNKTLGEVSDADELTSNFLVDIANQGKTGSSGSSGYTEGPVAEQRVYLIYGEDDFYSESVRTDADGNYQFTGLNRGDYRIYVFSEDTLLGQGAMVQKETAVSITEKKQVVTASGLFVVKL
jgi:hypothetical protein